MTTRFYVGKIKIHGSNLQSHHMLLSATLIVLRNHPLVVASSLKKGRDFFAGGLGWTVT
jgi:hypothetical protein